MDFSAGQTLLFNKPRGWSSFDVVRKVRNAIRIKKVGHAGTLDPLATGLLILCTGKHTKTIESIQGQEKEYLAHIKLGATTPCYDGEMPEENHQDASHITQEQIIAEMQTFVGEVEQTPPIFSAIKVDGKRAYKAARKGKEVKLKSRKIQVYEFTWLDWADEPAECYARIRCSKGTYIRSLAHDLGQQLGVGAYLKGLQRTKIGDFHVEDAWEINDFVEQFRVPKEPNP
ncbi:MAG: tRNA pseudouridine(55) synthase TruB [Bacteroidota bacterium]